MVWRDYVFSGSKDLDFLRYNYDPSSKPSII